MKSNRSSYLPGYIVVLAFLTVIGAGTSASAQVQLLPHVFVSANGGSDTNTCSRTSPCRQVQKALDSMLSGGTLTIVASGDYQAFTISKSANIVAEPGINAYIVTSGSGGYGGVGIGVSGTSVNTVRLRGLTVQAGGTGAIAINVPYNVDTFEIVDCEIRGGEYGLWASNEGNYSIKNTRFSSAVRNLNFNTSSGTINATVDGCTFNRGSAMTVGPNSRVTIKNSTANGGGFWASGTGARMFVDNCVINGSNDDGIFVDTGAYIRISDTTIANGLAYGIRVNGGSARSFGNNRLFNNASGDISGTVTVLSPQ